ncbi:unnamed protein product [Anisakis simplex]|uniref:WD_REPEATS_REGION domain-containing protein n=1 Tax=Anisakis simplex TaxID=6269 RepID=A0A0M3K6H7_ANISI|nr:unnamed protein product [Anisakis simplex]
MQGIAVSTTMSGEGSEVEMKQLDENALLVQHDWFNCIRNTQTDSGFFVGIREYGSPSTFIDVQQKSGKLFTAAPQKVHVEKLDARRLAVAYSDKAMAKSTFIAPRIEFTTVHESSVQSVDVSGTGRLVVSSDLNGKLVVWNADTAEIVRDFVGHALDVNRCRFFPSGLVVLSAGIDMTLRIWSVETGQCPRTLKGHTQC